MIPAIRFCVEHHWDDVRAKCHSLAQYARGQIGLLTNLPPLSPDSTDWYIQMVTLPLPPCDAAKLKTRLYDEFRIEAPIIVWQDQPFIRVSIQAYNSLTDVEKLFGALDRILPESDKVSSFR